MPRVDDPRRTDFEPTPLGAVGLAGETTIGPVVQCGADHQSIALATVGGRLRDRLIARLVSEPLASTPPASGGLSPKLMAALVAAAGLAPAEPTLYLVATDPSQIWPSAAGRAGAGLAGPVGYNPLAPAAPALGGRLAAGPTPLDFGRVVARALALLSCIVGLQQYRLVEHKFEALTRPIELALVNSAADCVPEVLATMTAIDDLTDHYRATAWLAPDALARFALAEYEAHRLVERYRYLLKATPADSSVDLQLRHYSQRDGFAALVCALLDLRVAQLRLAVTIQEAPHLAERQARELILKTRQCSQTWQRLQQRVADLTTRLDEKLEDVTQPGRLAQVVAEFALVADAAAALGLTDVGSKYDAMLLQRRLHETFDREAKELEQFGPVLVAAAVAADEMERLLGSGPASGPTGLLLAYWRDDLGEHSYYLEHQFIHDAVAEVSAPALGPRDDHVAKRFAGW